MDFYTYQNGRDYDGIELGILLAIGRKGEK